MPAPINACTEAMVVLTLRPRCGGTTVSSSECRMRSGQASTFTLRAASTAPRSHPRADAPTGASPGAAKTPTATLTPPTPGSPLRAAELPQGDAHAARPSAEHPNKPPTRCAQASKGPVNEVAFSKGTHKQGGGRTLSPQSVFAAMWVGLEHVVLKKKKDVGLWTLRNSNIDI